MEEEFHPFVGNPIKLGGAAGTPFFASINLKIFRRKSKNPPSLITHNSSLITLAFGYFKLTINPILAFIKIAKIDINNINII